MRQYNQIMVKVPKGEKLWWMYKNKSGRPIFLLTSKLNNRDNYYLYEITPEEELVKLGRAKTPPELEKKFHVNELMFEK